MARKTLNRGGFFPSEPTVSVGPPPLRGGFFKKEEQPVPASPSELLTKALQSLVGGDNAPPSDTLPLAKQNAAISEGYGVGRPTGAASAQINALSYTEVTLDSGFPDREYYDDIQVTDDAGMVFVFRPIKKAKFTSPVGTLELNFALPDVEEFLVDEIPSGNME